MPQSEKGNPLDVLIFPPDGLPPPETTTQFATTRTEELIVFGPKRKNLLFTLALATGPVVFAAIVLPFASNGLVTHFGVHGPRVVWFAAIVLGLVIAAIDRFISTRTYQRGPILMLNRNSNELQMPRSGESFDRENVRSAQFVACEVRTDISRLRRGYFWLSQFSIRVQAAGESPVQQLVLTSVYHRRNNGPLERAIDEFCSSSAIQIDELRFGPEASIRDDEIHHHTKQWRFLG